MSGSSGGNSYDGASDIAVARLALQESANNGSHTYDSIRYEQVFNFKDPPSIKPVSGDFNEYIFPLRPYNGNEGNDFGKHKSPKPVGRDLSGLRPKTVPSSSITEMGEADVDAYFTVLRSDLGSLYSQQGGGHFQQTTPDNNKA